jgi:ABC-type glycerol-3-phosphate transport system permease component
MIKIPLSLTKFQPFRYTINYLVVILVAMSMLLPFLWMILTSFKLRGEIMSFPPTFLPKTWTLENYVDAFNRLDMVRLYINTGYVAVLKTAIHLYLSLLLGYVFGKLKFKGRELIFYFILATMILPFEVYMIPLYRMMVGLKLGDSHLALIVPMLFSAYAIFMMRQFMFTIPNDLIDAARVDGAGEWYIVNRIIMPLCKPILATLGSFYFMWNWNEFLWPLIVITTPSKQMLPVALSGFVAEHGLNYGLIMAGATMSVIPVLIIFIVFQRYVVEGIALTGLK